MGLTSQKKRSKHSYNVVNQPCNFRAFTKYYTRTPTRYLRFPLAERGTVKRKQRSQRTFLRTASSSSKQKLERKQQPQNRTHTNNPTLLPANNPSPADDTPNLAAGCGSRKNRSPISNSYQLSLSNKTEGTISGRIQIPCRWLGAVSSYSTSNVKSQPPPS